jgi:hypothetical protein
MLILRNRVQSLPLRLPIRDAGDRPRRHPKLRDEIVEIGSNPREKKSADVLEQKRAGANPSDGAHGLGEHVSVVVLAPEPSALTERLTRRPCGYEVDPLEIGIVELADIHALYVRRRCAEASRIRSQRGATVPIKIRE